VCHRVAYEAEAAMRFEGLARQVLAQTPDAYTFALGTGELIIIDPVPVLSAAVDDVREGVPREIIAARFHRAVAQLVTGVALELRRRTTINTVALSGGVFLNVLLTRLCVEGLDAAGFKVLAHHHVPPSDAGLALGQLVIGAHQQERRSTCA